MAAISLLESISGRKAAWHRGAWIGIWGLFAIVSSWAEESSAPIHPFHGPSITWKEGPEYPMGIQDSAFGVVHGVVVSAGGFTRHPKDIRRLYPDAFGGKVDGFTKLAFAFDPSAPELGWRRIADLPGPARQATIAAVVDDTLFAIGGFSYSAPYSYRSTCRLDRRGGNWAWTETGCSVPWPVCEGSAVVIGRKIFLVAAADYFRPSAQDGAENFYTEHGRDNSPVGRALLVLDTANLAAGWQRLADLPGVPRAYAAVAAVAGEVFVLGGLYSPIRTGAEAASHNLNVWYYNAEGSWRYRPRANAWSSVPGVPDNANSRAVAFRDRYVITVGGFKYSHTWRGDGTRQDVYGQREKAYTSVALEKHPDMAAAELIENNVTIYDTRTGKIGAMAPLLDPSSWPMAAIDGSILYCLGGEGGSRLWHPATFQIGTIQGGRPD